MVQGALGMALKEEYGTTNLTDIVRDVRCKLFQQFMIVLIIMLILSRINKSDQKEKKKRKKPISRRLFSETKVLQDVLDEPLDKLP